MERPKVIFLDAVGTIFGVKGSVGEVYSQIAREFGVTISPARLNKAFVHSFKAAPPPIFLDAEPADIPQREFDWWRTIALNTFETAGALKQFPDFSAFFSELYIHFGTAEPWFIYADVLPSLMNWRRLGIEMGIISNFDSRIYSVLQSLGLSDYFTSVTIFVPDLSKFLSSQLLSPLDSLRQCCRQCAMLPLADNYVFLKQQ